jgi:hypothetical protein
MHWTFTKYLQPIFSLSELDVLAMKALQDRVNIVPVIAKADTLMAEEMKELKKKVRFCNVHFTISTCFSSSKTSPPMKSSCTSFQHRTRAKRTSRTIAVAFRLPLLDPTSCVIMVVHVPGSESELFLGI